MSQSPNDTLADIMIKSYRWAGPYTPLKGFRSIIINQFRFIGINMCGLKITEFGAVGELILSDLNDKDSEVGIVVRLNNINRRRDFHFTDVACIIPKYNIWFTALREGPIISITDSDIRYILELISSNFNGYNCLEEPRL